MKDDETLSAREGADGASFDGGIETRRLQAVLESKMFGREARPVRAGRFEIVERIGEGAMGAVYVAQDPELDREVAVKILRKQLGGSAGSDGTSRLRREARALAQLSHPNVVEVLDVGVEDGQVFVAMEYVRGRTLAQWCEEHPPGDPQRFERVHELALEAASGLIAAHQAGVVHRDLKPHNILVGEDGRLRIADFGLARGTGEPVAEALDLPSLPPHDGAEEPLSSLTATGQAVGTPAYMAPEQFEGRFDEHSDQFSFCVTFWEASYGQRPFVGETVSELWSAIAQGSITEPPSDSDVPRWFDEALRRGMRPQPEQRFATMADLAAALSGPPPTRRRWRVAAGLSAVGVGALWIASQGAERATERCENAGAPADAVWNARRREAFRASLMDAGGSQAEQFDKTAERIDRYTQAWVATRQRACAQAWQGDNDAQTDLDVTMQCLDARLSRVRSLLDAVDDASEEGVDAARFDEAVRGLVPPEGCESVESIRAEVLIRSDPQRAEVVRQLESEVEEFMATSAVSPNRATRAWAEDLVTRARASEHGPSLARTLQILGERQAIDRDVAAPETFAEAYDVATRWGVFRIAVEAAVSAAVVLERDHGRYADAEQSLRQAEALLPRIDTGAEAIRSHIARTRSALLIAQGQYSDAVDALRDQLENDEARGTNGRLDVGRTREAMGDGLVKLGRFEEAAAEYQRSLEIYRTELGPEHPDVATALTSLGLVAFERADGESAREAFEEARKIVGRLVGRNHPLYAQTEANVGNAYLLLGDRERAERAHRNALRVFDEALPETHPIRSIARVNLAEFLDDEQAEPLLNEALALAEEHLGADSVEATSARSALGRLYRRTGRPGQAIVALQRAMDLHEQFGRARRVISDRTDLARALADLGEWSRAETLADRALRDAEALFGPDSPRLLGPLVAVAVVDMAGDRVDPARSLLTRARDLPGAQNRDPATYREATRMLSELAGDDVRGVR